MKALKGLTKEEAMVDFYWPELRIRERTSCCGRESAKIQVCKFLAYVCTSVDIWYFLCIAGRCPSLPISESLFSDLNLRFLHVVSQFLG